MRLKRATIKDIAKESGFSVMTVSFALRNHEKVKELTRLKIQEVADRLGYKPDPEMVRLMNQVRRNRELETTEKFALLNAYPDSQKLKVDLFTQEIIKGVQSRLERHGFDLIECCASGDDLNNDSLNAQLKAEGVKGILLPIMPEDRAKALHLDWDSFSVVSIDERPVLPQFHRVHPHHYNNMLKALKVLESRGFKRIGFLSVSQMLGLDNYAYFAAFDAYFKYFTSGSNYLPPVENIEDKTALKDWYRKYQPDCVIVTAGWIEGFLRGVLDVSIPDDFSIATIGAEFESISGIDQKPKLLGSAAADLLMAHVNRYERGIPPFAKTVLIDGEWVDRGSVASF